MKLSDYLPVDHIKYNMTGATKIEIIEELPKISGIEFLKEVSKQEWEEGTSKNNIWDNQIRHFLIK